MNIIKAGLFAFVLAATSFVVPAYGVEMIGRESSSSAEIAKKYYERGKYNKRYPRYRHHRGVYVRPYVHRPYYRRGPYLYRPYAYDPYFYGPYNEGPYYRGGNGVYLQFRL
ncbi:MAG: hypothetical protein VX777_00565 [Chlamydiota bacterium]|nr:hypothetical protein [Chlamydiota bacterium]